MSFDKNMNLELMKQYTSNEDSSKYRNEIVTNENYKSRNLIVIGLIILVVIAITVMIILLVK